MTKTWVLESDVFPETHPALRDALSRRGCSIVSWKDEWWGDGVPANLGADVVFHGSLGNAARIECELQWSPGSFCPVDRFKCSSWYDQASEWLLHASWHLTTVAELVGNCEQIASGLGSADRVFVRPDSPLKPFSGRVLDTDSISLKALDHGFYYDDEQLPVVVAPVQDVGAEWRFIVARNAVVTGSSYDASARRGVDGEAIDEARKLAERIAASIPPPAEIYVLDICQCNGELKLLELNPFGGADLYGCNTTAIVDAIENL